MKNNQIYLKIFLFLGYFFFSQSVNAQQLEMLIEKAFANNPEIKKFELQYSIASEKVNEVQTIPNTEIGVGYFVREPETRTGAQRFKVSTRQMFPWFGSIAARENYINSLADAKYEDIVIAKRKLVASVSQTYFNLYANREKQEVLIENIQLLKTYETLALTSVEAGKASAVSVLRLQIRQNELEQLKSVLVYRYLANQTKLNKLLNRDKTISINTIDTLTIPTEIHLPSSGSIALHPELIKYDKLYKSVEQSELLNQKESNPMFGFGLNYINVDKRPNLNFSDNGKDILMPMVSLSIPIFNKKHASRTRQNQLKKKEITAQRQERLNTLEIVLDKAINERIATRISYETQMKNLKQAKSAERILIKSYETGTIDFRDVLDIQELQLKFQINQIEAVRSYYFQTIIINYLSK